METVVDVTIPTDQFVLEETLEQTPDAEFASVRFATHGSACTVPFLWGSAKRPDQLETALRNDPSIRCVNRLSRSDDRGLYSVDWTTRAAYVIDRFAETDGSVLDIRSGSDKWTARILFPDRAMASETFQTWCDDGLDLSLSRISNLSCRGNGETGLSATQHDTLAKAFETDYYNVPRGTTLAELATHFEVSHQAMSERLRRGHAHLVERLLPEPTVSRARGP